MTLPKTMPTLTGCRFFAALGVLLLHTASFVHFPSPLAMLASQGQSGVAFFFILSGFILTHTYQDIGKEPDWEKKRRFFAHRFARIYPVHLLVLVLITPIGIYLFHGKYSPGEFMLSWLANLILIQAFIPNPLFGQVWNAPAWSICCEAFFYSCFPRISRSMEIVSARKRLVTAGLISLAWSVVSFLIVFAIWYASGFRTDGLASKVEYWVLRDPLCRIGEFVLGCVLYRCLVDEETGLERRFANRKARNLGLAIGLAWLIVVMVAVLAFRHSDSALAIAMRGLGSFVLPEPAFGLLIVVLASGGTMLTPILEHPFIVLLGESSYALYMIHWIAWGALDRLPETSIRWKIVAIVLVIPTSIACYKWIETPSRRWIRSFLRA
jgi:peptidoglycan/LPS O-acetylase OafA/YrhL